MMTGWGETMREEGETAPEVDAVIGKPPRMQELNDLLLRIIRRANATLETFPAAGRHPHRRSFSVPFCAHAGKFQLMSRIVKWPVALTIAGSDSGGGAGIQADLKTFAALGVHGASVITCLTAQNPRRVLAIEPCSPQIVRQQMEAVFEELRPAAVKTGMLFSAEIIRAVADFFKSDRAPAARGGSGHDFNQRRGAAETGGDKILRKQLLPLATLVTPNLDETEILTGCKIASVENMRAAAREIHARFGCAALVKGGHLRGVREAVDIFLMAGRNCC